MSLGYVQMPLFVSLLPPGSAFGAEGQQLSEEAHPKTRVHGSHSAAGPMVAKIYPEWII